MIIAVFSMRDPDICHPHYSPRLPHEHVFDRKIFYAFGSGSSRTSVVSDSRLQAFNEFALALTLLLSRASN